MAEKAPLCRLGEMIVGSTELFDDPDDALPLSHSLAPAGRQASCCSMASPPCRCCLLLPPDLVRCTASGGPPRGSSTTACCPTGADASWHWLLPAAMAIDKQPTGPLGRLRVNLQPCIRCIRCSPAQGHQASCCLSYTATLPLLLPDCSRATAIGTADEPTKRGGSSTTAS